MAGTGMTRHWHPEGEDDMSGRGSRRLAPAVDADGGGGGGGGGATRDGEREREVG